MTALPLDWPLVKPAAGILDFQFNWGPSPTSPTGWLNGDTLTASTFAVATSDGSTAVAVGATSFTATAATVWLSGGTAGISSVVNHVTTAAGRQMDWTMPLRVEAT